MIRKLVKIVVYGSVTITPAYAQKPITSSITSPIQACVQATQKLQVPDQIHLVDACQVPPEILPKLSFLFSESGIDIYRIEPLTSTNSAGTRGQVYPERQRPVGVSALFVLQDEKERQTQIQSFINAGEAVSWLRGGYRYNSTLPADWTPVLSIKYVTYRFTIIGSSVLLVEAHMYAPEECYAYKTKCVNGEKLDWDTAPNFRSSEIAAYNNYSPSPLPQDSLLYRVAMLLGKPKAQSSKK